jgi:hypothetical protein
LSFLKISGFHYCRKSGGTNGQPEERPLFLSITSKGDTATNFALPLGQSASLAIDSLTTRKARHYDNPKSECLPSGIDAQSDYFRHSAANMEALQSHTMDVCSAENRAKLLSDDPPPYILGACADVSDIAHCPKEKLYCIVRKDQVWNDTAYWVMQIPEVFVRDHTSVFGPELQKLLASFISKHKSGTGQQVYYNIR